MKFQMRLMSKNTSPKCAHTPRSTYNSLSLHRLGGPFTLGESIATGARREGKAGSILRPRWGGPEWRPRQCCHFLNLPSSEVALGSPTPPTRVAAPPRASLLDDDAQVSGRSLRRAEALKGIEACFPFPPAFLSTLLRHPRHSGCWFSSEETHSQSEGEEFLRRWLFFPSSSSFVRPRLTFDEDISPADPSIDCAPRAPPPPP